MMRIGGGWKTSIGIRDLCHGASCGLAVATFARGLSLRKSATLLIDRCRSTPSRKNLKIIQDMMKGPRLWVTGNAPVLGAR